MYRFHPDRRKFLKYSSTLLAGSFILGIEMGCRSPSSQDVEQSVYSPNAWLTVSSDNHVTIIVAESEMGQGTYTALPMMVAEELEVDLQQVTIERASADPVYGYQLTGGSSSVRNGWESLRQAGGIAREIFLRAAAKKLSVPASECVANAGQIRHGPSAKTLTYGELIEFAMQIELPEEVSLKEFHEFRIIGKSVNRTDIAAKIDGSAQFGIDVRLPGQLFATVVHCPVFSGKPRNIDSTRARKINGVIDIFQIAEGVAVVASDTWTAFRAARSLSIEWDYGPDRQYSTDSITNIIRTLDNKNAVIDKNTGSVESIFRKSKTIHSSGYLQPFQAHMTMEPMNCTAHFNSQGVLDIWAPTQSPSAAYDTARLLTQSALERNVKRIKHKLFNDFDDSIDIHTTLLGGGFGRRLKQDFVSEAVQIAEHFEQPVQLVWPREEDVQHDFYHPLTYHEMKAALDEEGFPVAWKHVIKGSNVSAHGAEHSYAIANQRIEVVNWKDTVPTGQWRSVAPHYNVFAVEHFIDELAAISGKDPVLYRLALLRKAPRLRLALETAAERINWSGRSRGMLFYGAAAAETFGSHVVQMVELEKVSAQQYRVNRVVCVVDCGIAINPDIVKQQMESSVIFGLSAATKSKITFQNGRVQQSNFHDYPILGIEDTPAIEVIIIKSSEDPGGVGEPGVPPLAPALANAMFAETGLPVIELPMRLKL